MICCEPSSSNESKTASTTSRCALILCGISGSARRKSFLLTTPSSLNSASQSESMRITSSATSAPALPMLWMNSPSGETTCSRWLTVSEMHRLPSGSAQMCRGSRNWPGLRPDSPKWRSWMSTADVALFHTIVFVVPAFVKLGKGGSYLSWRVATNELTLDIIYGHIKTLSIVTCGTRANLCLVKAYLFWRPFVNWFLRSTHSFTH